MEFLIPIYRLAHFLGLALLLGGTLASVILVRKEEAKSYTTAKIAWNCMHLIAAPGLMILLISGLLQSSAYYWQHFKGAGYMHAKIMLAFFLLIAMIIDMRTQKRILREQPAPERLLGLIKKRQSYGVSICALTLIIMWLVSYQPF